MLTYDEFLQNKAELAPRFGFEVQDSEIHPILKPHQRVIVRWMVDGGRRACFASFGLGKSIMQLESIRLTLKHTGGKGLIIMPLGVRQEFIHDAKMIDLNVKFIRRIEEAEDPEGIYLTNYETVRDRKIDPTCFNAASLDEAACFTGDTLVDSPNGSVEIQNIMIGDEIINVGGIDIVKDVFKREVFTAAKIRTGGREIISSSDHLYFTQKGWVPASKLQPGDCIMQTTAAMHLVRKGVLPELPEREAKVLREFLLREMECSAPRNEESIVSRRFPLQTTETLLEGKRRKENEISNFARVESVEILEQGHPDLERYRNAEGRIYFYDLTATRHPSFSVNGLLVHNCLRAFGGSLTFRTFMATLAGDDHSGTYTEGVQYRYVATALPTPNDYIELLCYSAYLGILPVSEAKTRWFKRDSTKADKLTLLPSRERDFWFWVSSWAVFLTKPSDFGPEFSDEGYDLPPLEVRWHKIPTDHSYAGYERNGQRRLFCNAAIGVQDSAREKRNSLQGRINKMLELRAEAPGDHLIVWHDLEAERKALEKVLPTAVSIYGSRDLEEREKDVIAFSCGEKKELLAKPCMLGSGVNLQRHCHWAIYLGIGFKFNDFCQSLYRIHRFLQSKQCRIDLIYTEAENEIRKQLEHKWNQHKELVRKMTDIIKQYGLSQAAMMQALRKSIGIDRIEITGKKYKLINNDCVQETRSLDSNSVGLILTSIPYSTQYEYTPSYNDFGNNPSNEKFFEQMDYLTPELLRVLKPGRIAAIHVKDRVVPGGINSLGFQTVYRFHSKTADHFEKHGFAYLGMKTIVTDVVRENNQTYRLGWTEQCKDGTKMGVGMPEYLLLFRKPPTDTINSYADIPVVKSKQQYSRSRWQIDAHGFARSNGNRLLTAEDLKDLPHEAIFKIFRKYNLENVYDFEHHVKLGESLELEGRLPVTFMLLQPQSWHPDVWTDITRMRTLNTSQYQKGATFHLCPMQFDIADRVIEQCSMEGEIVFDPFAGLCTVPYRAILKKRYGIGIELSHSYIMDGVAYCQAAEKKIEMPTLFDIADKHNLEKENIDAIQRNS